MVKRSTTAMSKMIRIGDAQQGAFDAYVADAGGDDKKPALLVVPSIWGVTDGLKRTVDRYASRGYLAIAADPFWRTIPGPLDATRLDDALDRLGRWTVDEGLSDLRATLDVVAALPGWNHKFAILGFCFGGQHAVLGLTHLSADAAVAFHGVGMLRLLDGAGPVSQPYSFHFAEHDRTVPLAEVDAVRAILPADNGDVAVYRGTHHGFAQEESPHYDPAAVTLSEERAFAMLEQLKSGAR